jgi:hypothetical protein
MPSFLDQLPDFLELGKWTRFHIRPLFDLFSNPDVAPALALIIFCTALALGLLFLLDCTFIRMQVRRRTRTVRSIKSRAEFAEAMPQIEKRMLGTKYLRHSWQKFRETLIEPTDQDRTQRVVLNTTRPQNYFNTAEAGLRFPLYRAMPNLLVGIGLLLTFFGLVTALYFTTDAIRNTTDLAVSQNALRDLLYAASFKFYTSIAGLGGSIILTLVLRYGTSAIESDFDALASALEAKLAFVTPESIAFNHFREAQEQTKNLKLFNTEVAISVGKRIEEALAATLPAYLAQAMAPIGKSLDEVANKLTSMNEGAIGQMAGNFVEKLQGATGEQMHGLATTLGDLRTSFEQINHGMSESGAGLNQATQNFQNVTERMATRIEEAVAAVTRGLASESASIGERLAQAAISAGEESRTRVVGAGNDLAETLSGIGRQLADAVGLMQGSLTGAVQEMSNIERSIALHVGSIGQLFPVSTAETN